MHPEPELLALSALGEDVGPDHRRHIDECPECGREVAELTQLVGLGRTSADQPELITPPPGVWERTRAELGFGQAAPAPVVAPSSAPRHALEPPRPRRRRLVVLLALAAALALLVGYGLGQVLPLPDRGETIARSQLAALPSWPDSSGTATVELGRDGHRTLVVSLTTGQPVEGSREVWLISADQTSLLSLGYLAGTTGRFVIPDGLDLARYPIVDVSREAYDDGDPAHSGNSIVRGRLGL